MVHRLVKAPLFVLLISIKYILEDDLCSSGKFRYYCKPTTVPHKRKTARLLSHFPFSTFHFQHMTTGEVIVDSGVIIYCLKTKYYLSLQLSVQVEYASRPELGILLFNSDAG